MAAPRPAPAACDGSSLPTARPPCPAPLLVCLQLRPLASVCIGVGSALGHPTWGPGENAGGQTKPWGCQGDGAFPWDLGAQSL